MATDLMTLGVLGMVMLGGWLIDHVGQQAKARLARARKPVQHEATAGRPSPRCRRSG